jgi:hypothetical protein
MEPEGSLSSSQEPKIFLILSKIKPGYTSSAYLKNDININLASSNKFPGVFFLSRFSNRKFV